MPSPPVLRLCCSLTLLLFGCGDRGEAPVGELDADSSQREVVSAPTPPRVPDWQALAEAALAGRGEAGAIVILDAKDGALLGLAEKAGRVEHPAANARHPASSIKPLVALAALAEGKVDPIETVRCAGPRQIDGNSYTCFDDHGEVNLDRAMRTSCNHFAYELATRLSAEQLETHLRNFGLGRATGLLPKDLGEEQLGAIAARDGIANAIGHGGLTATPLQMARAYAALATGRIPARVEAPLPYRPAQLGKIQKALVGTVEDAEGSGTEARIDGLHIAGKTGTAELEAVEGDGSKYLSWFASWAPAEDPQIVVVVQLESEEPAPTSAVPAVRPIYEALSKDP